MLKYLLAALMGWMLCSCDDGKQNYYQLRVDSDYFDIEELLADETPEEVKAKVDKPRSYALVSASDDMAVWRMKKGTVFTIYEDDDRGPKENLMVIDGEVVADGVIKPWTANNGYIPAGLTMIKDGELGEVKGGLTLSEYQTLLNEVCPPKAQARRHFLWVNIIMLIGAIAVMVSIGLFSDKKDENQLPEEGGAVPEKKQYSMGFILLIGVLMLLPFFAPFLYFYFNPKESMWFINDWGFWGGLLGIGIIFGTELMACAPLFMIGDSLRRLFSSDWKRGILEVLACAVLCVVSCFFIKMTMVQLWDQCGFLLKSVGVIAVIFMLPTGLASGFKSRGTLYGSDGSATDVISSRDGGREVVGSDGKVYTRGSDGEYHS